MSKGFNGLIRRVSSARSTSSFESPTPTTRTNSMQSGCDDGQQQVSFYLTFLFRVILKAHGLSVVRKRLPEALSPFQLKVTGND